MTNNIYTISYSINIIYTNMFKIIKNLFLKKEVINADIAIIDDSFPQKIPVGFRNVEINGLINSVDNCNVYTMYKMFPKKEAWFKHGYGISKEQFEENKQNYLKFYPENKNKIFYLDNNKKYNFKLAYSYFLAQTFTLLPFYEKHKIPFAFTLFCGGAFGINNKSVDKMLKKIFSSKYFKKVLVDQIVVKDYLINNNFTTEDKISFSHSGAPVQYGKEYILPKKFYKKDKDTFDICFVGFKYSQLGEDKGYDLVIESAKKLCKKYSNIHFHIVGNFDENVIDVSDIKDNITFYGIQKADFLRNFYTTMDICLSPNRPFVLYKGHFDGFPLQREAMYAGSLLLNTDELDNNRNNFKDDELIIIKPEINNIIEKIEYFYNHIDEMYKIAKKGQEKAIKYFNPDDRIEYLKSVFMEIINNRENNE